ncbi:TPA_asm: M [Fraxinus gammacytorhabdovirus 2]|nr:TPA_asm: M [Fraxinus gammacytorhabdovirus 2]
MTDVKSDDQNRCKSGLYPSLTEFKNNFNHLYLTLVGSIRVHGDIIPSLDDCYKIITAEANSNKLTELEKDVLDIVVWVAKQNNKSCVHIHGESSIFFGPNTLVTKIIPMERVFILSKRTSVPEKIIDINICTEGQWNFLEKDWMIEIRLKGHVKRLSTEESIHFSVEHKNHYVKSDKYNPYCMCSCE